MFNSIKEKLAFDTLSSMTIPSRSGSIDKLSGNLVHFLLRKNKGSNKDLKSNKTPPGNSRKLKIKKIKKYSRPLTALVVVLLLVVLGSKMFSSGDSGTRVRGEQDDTSVNEPINKVDIHKEFTFPLSDGNGEEVSRIKYEIESVESRDEIVVKGQKARSLQGRVFLIVNLKITNEHDQGIEIDTRDYVRLSRNGNKDEWLAPDIHNDPVEVQAISTKLTRVGFPLNETDKDLILRVGEIKGDKEELPIEIKLK